MKSRLNKHEGDASSAHVEAQEKYDKFTIPKTSIQSLLLQTPHMTRLCISSVLHGHSSFEISIAPRLGI